MRIYIWSSITLQCIHKDIISKSTKEKKLHRSGSLINSSNMHSSHHDMMKNEQNPMGAKRHSTQPCGTIKSTPRARRYQPDLQDGRR